MDIDSIEAVAIDGVLDTCSVDNSMWRDKNGSMTGRLVSTCARSCTGGLNAGCIEMDIGVGSVYDVLFSKNTATPDTPPYALRVRAPWVTDSSCLVSQGTSTICGGTDITWHGGLVSMGDPAHVGTIGRIDTTDMTDSLGDSVGDLDGGRKVGKVDKHVAFKANTVRYSSERSDLVYISLDRGMRITRIVTANTFSATAAQKLSKAKSREEILQICVKQHPNECILVERMGLPSTVGDVKMGWSFEQAYGSPMRAQSGVPGSILWVADLQRSGECHIKVGSWLLGSIPLNIENKLSTLFTQSASRVCTQPQAVVLVRPGFAWPTLLHKADTEWSITFLEMQDSNELGVPVDRK
ncbi:hypothetical protein T484DRAFT_1757872 [Baffinella frigidus]|nr:hypothetical protein T484DRAFT_1757872 [Cryptophyta sp. CCMP2293]